MKALLLTSVLFFFLLSSAQLLGATSLIQKSIEGDVIGVKQLIADGADVNARGDDSTWRKTALMEAAEKGFTEVVRALIDAGAALNTTNQHGRTALMFAARYGFDNIVLALVEKGANVNLIPNDEEGLSALMVASASGREGVVEILLKNGADVNAKSKTGMTSLDYALKGGHANIAQWLKAAGAK